jgi:hypothetical protein
MKPEIMMQMMQLMPLIQTFSTSKLTLRDVLSGRGAGAALRSQLLMQLPGKLEGKQQILTVFERAEELARAKRTDLLDVLMGSTSDPTVTDLLKKGIRSL